MSEARAMAGSPVAGADRVDLYRRRRGVVPHKRRSLLLRLLKPMATALALVGVPALAAAWAVTTPYLEIASIDVAGTQRVSSAWVRHALSGLEGSHLLGTGLADVERQLETHEWIRDIAVRKQLPDRLRVEIDERRPAAVLRLRDELYFVERDAHIIAPYDERLLDRRLLILNAPTGSTYEVAPALDLAARWRELAPPWSGPILEIEIVSDEDFRVHVQNLDFPVVASPAHLERGLERLSRLLPELGRRYPTLEFIDIRLHRQVVFEPAAAPQREEG